VARRQLALATRGCLIIDHEVILPVLLSFPRSFEGGRRRLRRLEQIVFLGTEFVARTPISAGLFG
jgi:hypothetical protein